MEKGRMAAEHTLTKAEALDGPRVRFVTGAPTHPNPVTAFKQGRSGESPERSFRVVGARCAKCGYLELYTEPD
jgi:hypothetical protein